MTRTRKNPRRTPTREPPHPRTGGGRRSAPPHAQRGSHSRSHVPALSLGKLSLHARGFGFVLTDVAGPDVFVPAHRIGGAMHGDRVRVEVEPSPKGLEGAIVEVIERNTHHLSGQLHVTSAGAWIEPDDERMPVPVRVDGALPRGARTGQGAIAEVTAYPDAAGQPLRARVVEIFEPGDYARYELRAILLREGVAEEFPEDVRAEAQALPRAATRLDLEGRTDLRDLDFVTIDPFDARDHDDAVWAERRRGGGWRALVAIADVSHYVREGSALDREAIARGCTIYLPSHAIPMLPEALSGQLASLVPDRDRLALVVEVEIAQNGAIERHRFLEAVIRSRARLTYEGAAHALGLADALPAQPAAEERRPLLRTLLELAQALGARRRERGALGFELPEAKVLLDPKTGLPRAVERTRGDPGVARAYNLVEELMLLANEVVADDLTKRGVPAIYRVHGPPDGQRIEAFLSLARGLGFSLAPDASVEPKALAQFLERIEGTPHAAPIGSLLLRAMQQATYDTKNIGHFGLATERYVHFTSPIRRYPDLAVHRIVRRIARGEHGAGGATSTKLAAQAASSTALERRAMEIEREVVSLYGALLMRERIGEVFDGAVVTGITEHGFYSMLASPFVSVLCPLGALPYDRYEVGRNGVRLVGTYSGRSYALGDKVRLRIEDVSIARRKVIGVPIEAGEPSASRPGEARDGPDRGRPKERRRGGREGPRKGAPAQPGGRRRR